MQIRKNCIAMQQWSDPNENFSFINKLDILSTNFPSSPNLMSSIPITSFKLLKKNNYRLFTINMFDIYSLDKLKYISKYSINSK